MDTGTSTGYVLEKLKSFKFDFPFRVQTCGSITRNTDIESSDVDIDLILELGPERLSNFQRFPENDDLLRASNPFYSVPNSRKHELNFAKYKDEVIKFKQSLADWLTQFQEFSVKNVSTVINLIYLGQSYDLAPCLLYDFHIDKGYFLTGTAIVRPGPRLTLQFSDVLRSGVKVREAETHGGFNRLGNSIKKTLNIYLALERDA